MYRSNKKWNINILLPLVTFTLLSASTALKAAPGTTPEIKKLIKECADCHGKNGVSEDNKTPTIVGMSKAYFEESIQAFIDKQRPAKVVKRDGKPDTDMTKIVADLKNDEIQALAKHYSEQQFVPVVQPFNPELAEPGKKLHRKYCEKCHENAGRNKEDDAGLLAGQQSEYLSDTLLQFREGKRKMGKKMRKKMEALEEKHGAAGFEQLIHFYASNP